MLCGELDASRFCRDAFRTLEYKRDVATQVLPEGILDLLLEAPAVVAADTLRVLSLVGDAAGDEAVNGPVELGEQAARLLSCLLYTSPRPRA